MLNIIWVLLYSLSIVSHRYLPRSRIIGSRTISPDISPRTFSTEQNANNVVKIEAGMMKQCFSSRSWINGVSGRHSQEPPFPGSVVIFIMLMLLYAKEVLINKKLGS